MIRVIRGYYHWCLLDSHFNCWLQQIYSRKFITTSWLLPKCHKPKAKGRMHTFFLLTETYAASLDDRHCLRVFACVYTTVFIPTAPGSWDKLTALNDLQSYLNFEAHDHGEKNHWEATMQ